MEKSPCVGCALENQDKNNATCLNCSKRVEYVLRIGPMTESMPLKAETKEIKKENIMSNKTTVKHVETRQALSSSAPVKNATCVRCNETKPLTKEYWRKNLKCKNGFDGTCKVCISKRTRERLEKNKHSRAITHKITSKPTKQPEKQCLFIDFQNYPELLNNVTAIAVAEFRRPEDQILFWINQNLIKKGVQNVEKR